VATSRAASEAFEVAELSAIGPLVSGARASLLLDATRVGAYERAWCASVAAHVASHPGDPRNAWARARLAWTNEPSLQPARAQLAFAVYLL
jgi:hypothetical protein